MVFETLITIRESIPHLSHAKFGFNQNFKILQNIENFCQENNCQPCFKSPEPKYPLFQY